MFEPAADAHRYHVLLIGLEATASVAKGVEIVEGTWMLRAADFAGVVIERRANLPARKTVVIEVRTDTGSVVSRTEFVLLGAAKPGT